ncbi:Derepression protein [Arsenophonus nasoniae]|uniref:Derepression protein n=1 Tax=Arsenophonus nasoniae TaxID=638 RepID=UPI003879BCD8
MNVIDIGVGKSVPKNSQKENTKPEMSIESYHKLNRAKNVSFHIHLHVRAHGLDYQPMPFLPDIFSYLSEDVSYVLEEVKDLGLVDHFENQSAEENT